MSKGKKGLLFTISGPSGVGKGTIIKQLRKDYPQFVFPVSCTTRAKRPKEKDGEVYNFISKEEFRDGIKRGRFLEYALVHEENYYGTLKKTIMDALDSGKTVMREVDIQGAHSIMKVVPKKNLVSIFIRAESAEKLVSRIFKRGKLPADEIERRMESAEREMADVKNYDYVVWNYEGRVADCIKEVKNIIENEVKKAGLRI